MRSLLRTFIRYPILGNAILVGLVVYGLIAFSNTKTTFFPPVEGENILIRAAYPGASPEEIEEGIVLKIEDNLQGITGVERVMSTSAENSAQITVEMISGHDINEVLQDVKNAVDQISSFPVGMEDLVVYKEEPREFGCSFVVSGDADLAELKQKARKIERELLALDGISKTDLSGFPSEEIQIGFRHDDLRRYGLSVSEVAASLAAANVKITGGKIKGPTEEFQIRADDKGYYAADLANHVVKSTADGAIVRLKDIATLTDGWAEDPNRTYFNGKPAVTVTVSVTNEEDLFEVSRLVTGYVDEFNGNNETVKLTILRDGSEIVGARARLLLANGTLGLILVLLFLSLSLNPRLSIWVALAIPVSFAGMFALGAAYGMTINVMSLMAMILVVGILVDDGIVIGENIYQKYERGAKPIQAAVEGTIEVLPAVTASIMTTVVIFMTFFFMEGRMGQAAGDIAFVVGATLTISLIEGIFILPAHIAHSKALHITADQKSRLEKASDRVLAWIRTKWYEPALRYCIANPFVSLSIPVALFLITLGAVYGSVIKSTFFPVIEHDSVTIQLEMPAGTPDRITDSILTGMEQKVWEVEDIYRSEHDDQPLIKSVRRIIGPGTHQGSMRVTLVEGEQREWSTMMSGNHIRDQIGPVPEAENFEVGDIGGRFGKPVSVALSSDNLDELRAAKIALKGELKKVSKLKDVVDDDPPGLREIHVKLRDKAFSLGLTTRDVMNQVRNGFFGSEAQRILRNTDEVKIYARYDQIDRSSIGDLERFWIALPDGREFPLGEIADLSIQRGVMSIKHIDARRVVSVAASISDPTESVTDILADIKTDIMPGIIARFPGVDFDFEGQSRESAKTTNAMLAVVPMTLTLMLLIMVVTFRSFSQTIVVFILVPFSLIGVAWGHYIQGFIISMLSLFGTIALIGIVINDSLVLVSAFNRHLKDGMHFDEALFAAGVTRFRAVLLTSLTTIAGLGPLMLETSFHAQFLSPMAVSVAYGLLFGTVLTLLVLPSMLVLANRFKVFGAWLVTGKRPTPEAVEPPVREQRFLSDE